MYISAEGSSDLSRSHSNCWAGKSFDPRPVSCYARLATENRGKPQFLPGFGSSLPPLTYLLITHPLSPPLITPSRLAWPWTRTAAARRRNGEELLAPLFLELRGVSRLNLLRSWWGIACCSDWIPAFGPLGVGSSMSFASSMLSLSSDRCVITVGVWKAAPFAFLLSRICGDAKSNSSSWIRFQHLQGLKTHNFSAPFTLSWWRDDLVPFFRFYIVLPPFFTGLLVVRRASSLCSVL